MSDEEINISHYRDIWQFLTKPLDPSYHSSPKELAQGDSAAKREPTDVEKKLLDFIPKGHTVTLNGLRDIPNRDMNHILNSWFTPQARVITRDSFKNSVYTVEGHWQLKHTREMMGWEPTQKVCQVPYVSSLLFKGRNLEQTQVSAPYIKAFLDIGMPEKLQEILESKDAMCMFGALRTIHVRPEAITYRSLLGYIVKQKSKASWMNAMHLM